MMVKKILSIICFLFLVSILCINVQAQVLTNYVKQKQQEMAEKQRIEKVNYEKSCKKGTLEAFKEYLTLYPNGKYSKDVKNRIADFSFWESTKSLNTIEAYQNYLQKSEFKSFALQANEAITDLKSIAEWNKIKLSSNLSEVEAFTVKYPRSSCLDDAGKRIHELKGVAFYNSGNLQSAYSEFKSAGGKNMLEQNNRSIFDICEEYVDYKKLGSYSNEDELQTFLTKYASSQYYNEISNRLAIVKAKKLNMYSGSYSFNEAMSYAKDDQTKSMVSKYIESSKNAYSQYKKAARHNRIMANGGYVKLGIEIMDFGWNGISPDRYLDVCYYNIGASVKFGNYKAPVQLELGIKPGLMIYSTVEGDDYDTAINAETKFHMPVYAKLKINICNIGENCKLYIAGLGYYNAIKDDYLESKFSIGGGTGIAWKRWDWLVLYYKQDLQKKYELDDKFLGSSLVLYL